MDTKKPSIGTRASNKCRYCNLATKCLPANVNKKILNQSELLDFKVRILEAGEHLYRQGESLESLYAIRTGMLKSYTTLESGQEYVMGFHMPPDLFGWEGIQKQQLSVSVVALKSSNICEIPLTQLEKIVKELPELETQLLKMVSQRINIDNIAMLRTTSEQRVANFILQLAQKYSALGQPSYLCRLSMTYQDIANYLRMAPETISRTLHKLQSKKIISLDKQQIHLKNIDALKKLAEINL